MLESITVLQSAKDAVTDVKTFTWGSREFAAERRKLDELFTKVKQCFSYFQVRRFLSVTLFGSLAFADRWPIRFVA